MSHIVSRERGTGCAQTEMSSSVAHPTIEWLRNLVATRPAQASEKPTFATNQPGDPNYFRMLAEWEHDTLPEANQLPPPCDYAEYERQVCVQHGFGMRTIYKDPLE